MQFDVAEEVLDEEDREEDREYGNFDSFEEDGEAGDGEGYQVARRSLASIFGEAEVVEVDDTQADESLLVGAALPKHAWDLMAAVALPDTELSVVVHLPTT